MPTIQQYLLALILGITFLNASAHAETYEGFDSPVDETALTADPVQRRGVPLEAHRPAEIPWAYERSRRVYDFARALTPTTEQSLNKRLQGTTLTVVTLTYRDGEPLTEFAERVRQQFSKEIPTNCTTPPPHVSAKHHHLCSACAAWEDRCFITMTPHHETDETVLVYDPIAKKHAVLAGQKAVLPQSIDTVLGALRQPYNPGQALKNYQPEPPRIGPTAPWRRNLRHTISQRGPESRSPLVSSWWFVLMICLSVSGMAYGLWHHTTQPSRPFQKKARKTPATDHIVYLVHR